ncbi:exonuclease [Isosphaera pallida ATCC 43644]|jgi:hypothetical protein|uniref:Exonuclease n=1 Tax=Isosphaera pallida (strain ATCC 43644 / DSM 9630 / IS1B) TaxID=575540 RepID=E8R3X4_ISOPI|nr:hypothetical protein [Isosphaera pallida]ADV63704.1 exonuclease [Isosphaera pallida ATCC 43644]
MSSSVVVETGSGPGGSPRLRGKTRCPACKAVQEWSDECRRCKCDLTLWHRLARDQARRRVAALTALARQRPQEAFDHARAAFRLGADAETARLAAVTALLSGQFVEALWYARLAESYG